jgi:DNA-binding response OmpR family regulator
VAQHGRDLGGVIVEDEAELASLIEYNLTRSGYEAQVFNGTAGTLKALEAASPDLIVLDVMLPDVTALKYAGRFAPPPPCPGPPCSS